MSPMPIRVPTDCRSQLHEGNFHSVRHLCWAWFLPDPSSMFCCRCTWTYEEHRKKLAPTHGRSTMTWPSRQRAETHRIPWYMAQETLLLRLHWIQYVLSCCCAKGSRSDIFIPSNCGWTHDIRWHDMKPNGRWEWLDCIWMQKNLVQLGDKLHDVDIWWLKPHRGGISCPLASEYSSTCFSDPVKLIGVC